jgi:hypothetical protein
LNHWGSESLKNGGTHRQPALAAFQMFNVQSLNDSMLSILALSGTKPSGIQLRSSQNNNVVVFFVVRLTWRHETNPLISKHLHSIWFRFPQAVEITSISPATFLIDFPGRAGAV